MLYYLFICCDINLLFGWSFIQDNESFYQPKVLKLVIEWCIKQIQQTGEHGPLSLLCDVLSSKICSSEVDISAVNGIIDGLVSNNENLLKIINKRLIPILIQRNTINTHQLLSEFTASKEIFSQLQYATIWCGIYNSIPDEHNVCIVFAKSHKNE